MGEHFLGPTVEVLFQPSSPDWNPNGTFVDALFESADRHGTTPMYTLYSMAAYGENNMSALTDDKYMTAY